MKILGIESSANVGSVAYLKDDEVIVEYTLNYRKTHSETLLPMIDDMGKKAEIDFSELDAIAVSAGPGSFTGLRIGSATAKGMGLALNIPIIPVSTTQALCYNLVGVSGLICPIMDARRSQVYTGIFRFNDNDELETVLDTTAIGIDELISILGDKGEKVTFVGDGVKVFGNIIAEQIKCEYRFASPANCLQRASSVALLGTKLMAAGITEHARDHAPIYLRMSQAERERLEKG